MNEVDVVRICHQRSKHQLQRYAAGPESLDWDAQPNPWRRYAGALVEPLPLAADAATASWPELFQAGAVAPWALDRHGLDALLQFSLGLGAAASSTGLGGSLEGCAAVPQAGACPSPDDRSRPRSP